MNVRRGGLLRVVMTSAGILAAIGGGKARCPAAEPSPALAEFTLKTRWADQVDRQLPLNEYPRPQLTRGNWTNLNGPWQYAITPREAGQPTEWEGEILVPFPVESQLSGVRREVGEARALWYRRTFASGGQPGGQRLLLHFGAVDWQTTVWVNGQEVGQHQGGYDPFSFEITGAVKPEGAENELVVRVWDPTDAESQPRGKQQRKPEGIWYTPVTGIWQTVWLERVLENYVRSLRVTPDLATGEVRIEADVVGAVKTIEAHLESPGSGEGLGGSQEGNAITLTVPKPRAWAPRDPVLYKLEVALDSGDRVESYFAFRTIEIRQAEDGHRRLFLNGKPQFQFGPLDQGWWPDGLYTAPTEEALLYDIEVTRELGFNLIRKHVKVEPARWYYHCDRLGVLVWQDMPSAMRVPPGPEFVLPFAKHDFDRDRASAAQFETELKAMIDALRPFPSIVMWVPFNEGWGQYDTARIAKLVKEYDPTRLVNCPSGWTDREAGDVLDLHHYPGPTVETPAAPRAGVLGEFGGLGWPVPDHLWWNKRNWGYRTYDSRQVLEARYADLLHALPGLIGRGLAAAVYTQTTDVEGEVNGLLTYDRAITKIDPAVAKELAAPVYARPARVMDYVQTTKVKPRSWRMTYEQPADDWATDAFRDASWLESRALSLDVKLGGPDEANPASFDEVWLRTTFEVSQLPKELYLQVSRAGGGDIAILLNGQNVMTLGDGDSTDLKFQHIRVDSKLLHSGQNVLGVHAKASRGGRSLDVGLYGTD